MKKITLSAVTAILLFFLSGCQKLLEYAESHGYPAPVKSLITKLDYRDSSHFVPGLPFTVEVNSFTFIYNSAHDPIYAIRAMKSTGRGHYVFRYDASGRLTDLIAAYDTAIAFNNVSSWHKYTYDANYNIVTDTVILSPLVINGQPTPNPNHYSNIVASYQYDPQHRMTRYQVFFNPGLPLPPNIDTSYSYDKNGNTTGVGHDNKVNFNRTSRILQFLDQDYSVNNPTTATYTYNKTGLPTSLSSSISIPLFIIPNEATTFVSAATLTYTTY